MEFVANIARHTAAPAAGMTRVFGAMVKTLADMVATRRALRELAGMDDYQLKDIGIHRSEINQAVRYGRDQSPTAAHRVAE
jgi:uncharacterized protein YjiS (DUF1127 family)